jgi:mannitol-1-phosphate/altronate dehydrogenase
MGLKAVHFGAGNIGRGFVAEFLHKVCFIAVLLEVANNSGSLDMRWFLETPWV